MKNPQRIAILGFAAAFTSVSVSACGSGDSGDSGGSGTVSPATTPTPRAPQAVTVLANPKNCDVQPMIVEAGTITVTATSTATIPISVALFAPQDGAFTNRLARIRVLKPGGTKIMTADLTQGAYEMACGTEVLESRKRITAI